MIRWSRWLLWLVCAALPGCAVVHLVSYVVWPDFPLYSNGERVELTGLESEVAATRRSDGLWRIEAENESDGLFVLGYLQARDRMGQLDLFRHLSRGEFAALAGDREFGGKSALAADRLNRFLGFRDDASRMLAMVSPGERASLESFVAGINAWIDEGKLSLEHRLMGVDEIRPWTAEDSLAIYLMVMHGLGGNADREIRRLAIACSAGIDAMERIWPTDMSYEFSSLPDDGRGGPRSPVAPAVVPDVAAELPALCGSPDAAKSAAAPVQVGWLSTLLSGWSASNNWAVSGAFTESGAALLSSDPHLPHMNPPMVWGFDFQTPDYRVVGFTLPGLYRVVFGHNGSVAWGATTNHVDRQDLVIHKPRSEERDGVVVEGYEVDGELVPFDTRTEEFAVRGGETVRQTVRFTRDGPLMNDLSDDLADLLPLLALRKVPIGRGTDLEGARMLTRVRTVEDFARAIDQLDLGCSSWVAADSSGSIAYRSPCLVPIRDGWRGTFPIAGWTSRYDWKGLYAKDQLPTSIAPSRGWLATANNQIVPPGALPSIYNNDVSAPDRVLRIAERLQQGRGSLDIESSSAIQMDLRDGTWPRSRPQLDEFCRPKGADAAVEHARRQLCAWDGEMAPDSVPATLYTLLTLSLVDHGLADELPGGADSEVWAFVQSLFQFEADVRWMWTRDPDDPVWDDASTSARETRDEILEVALADAVADGRELFGSDMEAWQWGEVRPFVLAHPFGAGSDVLGAVVNSDPIAIGGGNETVFKHQFPVSDRSEMKVVVGPIIRLTVDLGQPWSARYSMAGGESGWASSPFYGNLLADWAAGTSRPLTPQPSDGDIRVQFAPDMAS